LAHFRTWTPLEAPFASSLAPGAAGADAAVGLPLPGILSAAGVPCASSGVAHAAPVKFYTTLPHVLLRRRGE